MSAAKRSAIAKKGAAGEMEKEVMSGSAASKPFVQIACICEKVLIEPDNVPTLVRVVDTFSFQAAPLPAPGAAVQLTIFVALKSGDVVGEFEVGFRLHPPQGKTQPMRKWPVEMRGGEHGTNLKIDFALANPEVGLYWFDVLWGDETLTRIPFRLQAATAPEPTADAVVPSETTIR